jgi:hypothetical protein
MFGTHSLRRAKATLIHKRTGNLRAVQLLLGHTNIESTVRLRRLDCSVLRGAPQLGLCPKGGRIMGNPFVHVDRRGQAKSFYGKLFNWELEDVDMGDIVCPFWQVSF